jgi:hypothetical protein
LESSWLLSAFSYRGDPASLWALLGSIHPNSRAETPACAAVLQQILDKEEFTLEELLDEDDIIQECKSLNGRLITL